MRARALCNWVVGDLCVGGVVQDWRCGGVWFDEVVEVQVVSWWRCGCDEVGSVMWAELHGMRRFDGITTAGIVELNGKAVVIGMVWVIAGSGGGYGGVNCCELRARIREEIGVMAAMAVGTAGQIAGWAVMPAVMMAAAASWLLRWCSVRCGDAGDGWAKKKMELRGLIGFAGVDGFNSGRGCGDDGLLAVVEHGF
ncbi:hypothetical protein M0R45_027685 [Rubus argutus]|uniref:Uncharacterized protein n=1 Tax=Rubus argutus TaxID=59490 RepID=A0AAW1X2A9_RUBAR